jgi:hypothetical protein
MVPGKQVRSLREHSETADENPAPKMTKGRGRRRVRQAHDQREEQG